MGVRKRSCGSCYWYVQSGDERYGACHVNPPARYKQDRDDRPLVGEDEHECSQYFDREQYELSLAREVLGDDTR